MHKTLESLCVALEAFATYVENVGSEERTLAEAFGWHHPAITRHDLAGIPKTLASRIREVSPEKIDESLDRLLQDVPKRFETLKKHTVPYMFNGNGHQAVPAYTATFSSLQNILEPFFGWKTLSDNKALPTQLAKKLRSIQAELDEILPQKDTLKAQVQLIQDATSAAESLPADIQSLREARDKINRLSNETDELSKKIEQKTKDASKAALNIFEQKEEAIKLVQQCEEAYRITTTKGLAGAFDQRATRLTYSMWLWVSGLLSALVLGSYIGFQHYQSVSESLSLSTVQWETVWIKIIFSILSIGAPVWFAWLATKQIGQRFRLSEDYAFKASVAKAYEGYRREAARIDKAFELRLFESALSRLEEAPLRLVEQDSHGSPWHELLNSEGFQKALSTVPELKTKFADIISQGVSITKGFGKSLDKDK